MGGIGLEPTTSCVSIWLSDTKYSEWSLWTRFTGVKTRVRLKGDSKVTQSWTQRRPQVRWFRRGIGRGKTLTQRPRLVGSGQGD